MVSSFYLIPSVWRRKFEAGSHDEFKLVEHGEHGLWPMAVELSVCIVLTQPTYYSDLLLPKLPIP